MIKLEYPIEGMKYDLAQTFVQIISAIKELQDVHKTLLKTPNDGCDGVRKHQKDHLESEHDRFENFEE